MLDIFSRLIALVAGFCIGIDKVLNHAVPSTGGGKLLPKRFKKLDERITLVTAGPCSMLCDSFQTKDDVLRHVRGHWRGKFSFHGLGYANAFTAAHGTPNGMKVIASLTAGAEIHATGRAAKGTKVLEVHSRATNLSTAAEPPKRRPSGLCQHPLECP